MEGPVSEDEPPLPRRIRQEGPVEEPVRKDDHLPPRPPPPPGLLLARSSDHQV